MPALVIVGLLFTSIMLLVSAVTGNWWGFIGTLAIAMLVGLVVVIFPTMARTPAGQPNAWQRMNTWLQTHSGQLWRTIGVVTAILITLAALVVLLTKLPKCEGFVCSGKTATATTASTASSTGTVSVPTGAPKSAITVTTQELAPREQGAWIKLSSRCYSKLEIGAAPGDSVWTTNNRGETVASTVRGWRHDGTPVDSVRFALSEGGTVVVREICS